MMSDRASALEALLPAVEGNPLAMAHIGRLFQAEGQDERALDLCLRARAAAPDDTELATLIAGILSANVPSWHFRLVRDEPRNRAYESVLRRTIRPGCRVLEIGTGTGLLAMMAARAGAGRVITCEAKPIIARVARDIVAANGYANLVQVVGKHSMRLDADLDLGGRADVLVSDIVSNDGLAAGAVPSIEDAWRRLLMPDARVIPMRVRVQVALAEDRRRDQRRLGEVAGFDLSPFNFVAAPSYQIDAAAPRLALRSEPAALFAFDCQDGRRFLPAHASVTLTAHSGAVNGIAQWIGLDMDAHDSYEVRPGTGTCSCWATMFHPVDRLLAIQPGSTVHVHGRHDRQSLHLWTT